MLVDAFIKVNHTHFLGQQVNVLFVAGFRSVIQLYQSQSLGDKSKKSVTMTTARLWHTHKVPGVYTHSLSNQESNPVADTTTKPNQHKSSCLLIYSHNKALKLYFLYFAHLGSCSDGENKGRNGGAAQI